MTLTLDLNGAAVSTRLVDARFIVETLASYHTGTEWAFFPEMRSGTGYGAGNEQRIDAWAMHLWPSSNLKRIAYEIKVSRADFLHELKRPQKRKYALLWSNEFSFVTPRGLIKPEELPVEAGLIEIDGRGIWHNVVPPPWRDTPAPSWRFVAALARRVKAAK
jgi:hypothetical protein